MTDRADLSSFVCVAKTDAAECHYWGSWILHDVYGFVIERCNGDGIAVCRFYIGVADQHWHPTAGIGSLCLAMMKTCWASLSSWFTTTIRASKQARMSKLWRWYVKQILTVIRRWWSPIGCRWALASTIEASVRNRECSSVLDAGGGVEGDKWSLYWFTDFAGLPVTSFELYQYRWAKTRAAFNSAEVVQLWFSAFSGDNILHGRSFSYLSRWLQVLRQLFRAFLWDYRVLVTRGDFAIMLTGGGTDDSRSHGNISEAWELAMRSWLDQRYC